jgi:hypothetical protein
VPVAQGADGPEWAMNAGLQEPLKAPQPGRSVAATSISTRSLLSVGFLALLGLSNVASHVAVVRALLTPSGDLSGQGSSGRRAQKVRSEAVSR